MFALKSYYTFIIVIIFQDITALKSLPEVSENNIVQAEFVIRTIFNSLFHSLGLRNARQNTVINKQRTVHNNFITLTLKDYNTLKEIAKLTRVDKRSYENATDLISFIEEIVVENDIYKTDDKHEVNKKIFSIDDEINKLDSFKDLNIVQDNRNVSEEVLKILQQDNLKLDNVTDKVERGRKDIILEEIPTWREHDDIFVGRRIFNGVKTKIKHFPFMASVQIFGKFQCGGSIIKSDLVITAASCLQLSWNNRFFRENPAVLSVRVGSTYYEVGGEVIEVMEIYFQPSYNPKTLNHNIAVMRLARKIKYKKKHVSKVEIWRKHDWPSHVGKCIIVGWGANTRANMMHGAFEDRLRYAVLDSYPREECQEIYSGQYVTKHNFCAGYMSIGTGACNRDVGGPGIISGKLAGVVSFGSPNCGSADYPTVFTNLGYYYDWIEEIMDQHVPSRKRRTTTSKPNTNYSNLPQTPWKITPIVTRERPVLRNGPHFRNQKQIKKPIKETKNKIDSAKTEENNGNDEFKEFFKTLFNIIKANTMKGV